MKFERETKIGLFTIVALTSIYFGYNFLRGKKFFSNANTFYVKYNSVEGVVNSTPVYYKGLKVGQVEKIALITDGSINKVLVTLSINEKVILSKSSEANIVSLDLLGAKAIKLNIPDLVQPVESGDTLIGGEEEELTDIISNVVNPIKDKSEKVLVSIDKVLTDINKILQDGGRQTLSNSINDFGGTLSNLRKTSESLNLLVQREGTNIAHTIENLEQLSLALKGSSNNLAKVLENTKQITDSLSNAPIKSAIKNLENASKELDVLLANINKGEGTAGRLAKDSALYVNLNKSAYELQSLLNDFQKYPARYVNVSVFGGASKKANKLREKEKAKAQ